MPDTPPGVAALAGALATATGSEPTISKVPRGHRIECALPSDMSDVTRSTVLDTLALADRYGHIRTASDDSVWAEIDRKAAP
ncbi:hypothetical protein [Streptomyces sp. NPDC005805]|uniref:hypothetical protein n=1 Tax=Streptomyces sp. NPDC005805 TaxID=3157068 RepID=UPI0033DDFD67